MTLRDVRHLSLDLAGVACAAAGTVGFIIFLTKRRSNSKVKDQHDVQDVPWVTQARWYPVMGHGLAVLVLGRDNLFYGFGRLAALEHEKTGNGICRIDFIAPQVYLTDLELISEMFKRNYQVGEPIGKDWTKIPLWPFFKNLFGHGLFTAPDHEKKWSIAHRILMKPFSRQNIVSLIPLMNRSADLMVEALKRDIDHGGLVNMWKFTQMMAVETICTCAVGTSFDCFSGKPARFILALMELVEDIMSLSPVPAIVRPLCMKTRARINRNEAVLMEVINDIIHKRREGSTKAATQVPDILDVLLNNADPETGEKLNMESIRFNLMNLLLAGQDSTAAAMGSFFCFLAAKPQVEAKLMDEIRAVVGDSTDITSNHLSKMKYLDWTQKETLRLMPAVPVVFKNSYEDLTLGGKWKIPRGHFINVAFSAIHMDPKIWGEDAAEFVPERWEKGAPHTHAFLAFSSGPRACIGKEFTLTEQKICVAKVLQAFIFQRPSTMKVTPGHFLYKTVHKTASKPFPLRSPNVGIDVEFNPKALFTGCTSYLELYERPPAANRCQTSSDGSSMKMLHRQPRRLSRMLSARLSLSRAVSGTTSVAKDKTVFVAAPENHNTPLLILYGSDGGSTATMAGDVLQTAEGLGFKPRLTTMNNMANSMEIKSGDVCVLIITATYNGCPPANAAKFVTWLNDMHAKHESPFSSNMRYSVMGCGNSQWEGTYQAIPMLVDNALEDLGGHRILPLHACDGTGDPEGDFATWHNLIWPALGFGCGITITEASWDAPTAKKKLPPVEQMQSFTKVEPVGLSYELSGDFLQTEVVENRALHMIGGCTRHIEIDMGTKKYMAGDHLAIYPENDPSLVKVLMDRLKLKSDTVVRWTGKATIDLRAPLGDGKSHKLEEVLRRSVDLVKPATVEAILLMATKTSNRLDAVQMKGFETDDILELKVTILELLLKYPSVDLDIPELLSILPAMQRRYYSISSSPLMHPSRCSITVAVVEGLSPIGRQHRGVCSNYLQGMEVGSKIWVKVMDTGSSFRLPTEPKTPVILIGPGTGIAPLRGFLQEIKARKAQGVEAGAAHLFFGCHSPEKFLYEEELKAFNADGTLTSLNVAFSRAGAKQYVQDHIAKMSTTIWECLKMGGHIYVCGDASKMAPDVRRAIKDAVCKAGDMDPSEANSLVDQYCAVGENRRYHEDVWASG